MSVFKLDLNTAVDKGDVFQWVLCACVAVSTTAGCWAAVDDQAALLSPVASRMLGGSAMRAALNSGPMTPVAGVRRVIWRPSFTATATRRRHAGELPHYLDQLRGYEGGIVCRVEACPDPAEAVFTSITHLRFDPRLPPAREIVAYQKHRVKRLRRHAP